MGPRDGRFGSRLVVCGVEKLKGDAWLYDWYCWPRDGVAISKPPPTTEGEVEVTARELFELKMPLGRA